MKTNIKMIILAVVVLVVLGVIARQLTKTEETPVVSNDANVEVFDTNQANEPDVTQNSDESAVNSGVVQPSGQGTSNESANVARDGNIAIQEEFDAAKKLNTREALQLFIDRHPDHELSIQARVLLGAL